MTDQAPSADGPPPRPGRTGTALRWSVAGVMGRQAAVLLAAVIVARLLGPATYGAITAAMVYVLFTTLLLDQGLSAALVQRPDLDPRAPGAIATVNLISALVLAGLTFAVAPLIADFFAIAELTQILRWLGFGLVLKAMAITPRAMRARAMDFRAIAAADAAGAIVGAGAAITAALAGAGAATVIAQTLVTDLVVAGILVTASRGPMPNVDLAQVRLLLPYGVRVFASNAIAYFSRNLDSIVIGHWLGSAALATYAMAYRVLVLPVQLIGQSVSRVLFPAMSRLAHDRAALSRMLHRAVELLALAAVPPMALAAVSAPELVAVVLGEQWSAAAPVLTVLAIAGARETVFYVTGPLMKATGAVGLAVRYEVLATTVQVAGIVVGLRFGVLGVAIGYVIAGFVLAPVLMAIQRSLTGLALRAQLHAMGAAIHVAAWGVLAYLGVRALGLGQFPTLVIGAVAFGVVALGVLVVVHRAAFTRAREAIRGGNQTQEHVG